MQVKKYLVVFTASKINVFFQKINNTVQLLLHIVHIYIGFADYPSLIAFLACAKALAN